MKREDAIKALKWFKEYNEEDYCGGDRIQDKNGDWYYYITEQDFEAFEVAIKALEQEPCCNCIEFKKYAKEMGFEIEQEPKTGHWIKGYTFPDGEYWKCDKCNELIKVKYPMHYCNNCGSDNSEVKE